MKSLYITANSPGEISGWLMPLAAALRKMRPDIAISVLLLPCVFASGREEQVVSEIPGIVKVIPARRFFPLLLEGACPDRDAALLHLGGDLMYTAMLALRWRVPAWCYLWAHPLWDRAYTGYFVRNEQDRRRLMRLKVAPHKIHIVGNLLADAVEMQRSAAPPPPAAGGPLFAFLPGSRLRELTFILPFFLEVAEKIRATVADARFSLVISPYLDRDEVRAVAEIPVDRKFGGIRGAFDRERDTLVSPGGTELRFDYSGGVPAMAASDFVITIPGTKTGEAGCLGKPMICILPLNRPEQIPYIGLVGLLEWLPLVGSFLKGRLIIEIAKKVTWLSQPNMLAGELVVPELISIVTPQLVAERVLSTFGDGEELEAMKRRLVELYAPFKGSAARMAEIMMEGRPGAPPPETAADRAAHTQATERKPRLSVIICTYNRAKLLAGALETLGAQTLPRDDYEIVVVDDGSPDNTGSMIAALALPCTLRYFPKERRGRAAARNFGIARARGDFILFVDDDVLAVPDLLAQHLAMLEKRGSTVVRGPIINVEEYVIPATPRAELKDYSQAFFCTCNASVRRTSLMKVGGFDESFVEYGWEDNEVGWRLRRSGLTARFNMDAIVYHYKPALKPGELDRLVQQARELGRNAVAYMAKHPHWIVRMATGAYAPNTWLSALRYTPQRCREWEERWNSLPPGTTPQKKELEKMIYQGHYFLAMREEMRNSPSRNPGDMGGQA